MSINLGINGFGRIGRLVVRSLFEGDASDVNVVGINDLAERETLTHLFKYDSAHGKYPGEVSLSGEKLSVDGNEIPLFQKKDPSELPWGELDCDVVIESTGIFRTREKASKHLDAGARKVVISAPAKSEVDATIVLGVNDDQLTGDEEIVSNASCTTNCLAPMVKVLNDAFGLKRGLMTTVHAYTASQNLQDGPHGKDLRRARAAAESMIPTSTGAAKAIDLVMPELEGRLDGMAVRVPVICGSMVDLVVNLEQEVSVENVDEAFRAAANDSLSGILQYSEDSLVSTDIVHNPHSCIYDVGSTFVQGNMVKVLGWYDNEWGYANRIADLGQKLVELEN